MRVSEQLDEQVSQTANRFASYTGRNTRESNSHKSLDRAREPPMKKTSKEPIAIQQKGREAENKQAIQHMRAWE